MNGPKRENLKALLKKFFGPEQAEDAAEDIRKGEQILRENPAAGPDEKIIDDIKLNLAEVLHRRKGSVFRKTAYRAVAVAAAAVLVVVVVKLLESDTDFEKPGIDSTISKVIWESGTLVADDEDLLILAEEIRQIEAETLALRLGEGNDYQQMDVGELEVELMEMNGDFWKG